MRILLTADHVLAHDGSTHVELRDGAVIVDDSLISYVGPRADAPEDGIDERIELGESLLMPGLIDLDALTDIDHLLIDSWWSSEHSARLQWSAGYFAGERRHVFSTEERREVREYALLQLAMHGITSYMPIASEVHSDWAESYDDLVAMAEVSRGIGLRGFLGPSYRSGVNAVTASGTRTVLMDEAEGEAGFADALRFLDHLAELSDPLLTGVLLPCRIETLTSALLAQTAVAARERGAIVRLHALQGEFERGYILENYGHTPLEHIREAGLLAARLIVPHGIFLDVNPRVDGEDNGDLAVLADNDVSIVHCPLTNVRYGSNLETFTLYREHGVNLCLGTDSFPPDLIRGIDAGVQLSKAQHGDLSRGDLAGYIEAATLGGAAALGRDDLGRIAPGAQADLTAFRLDDFRMGVTDDPLRTLVLNGTGRDASLTMVAGAIVMRDGVIPGVDLAAMRTRGQALFEKMRAAYTERDYRGGTNDELFPPVFPVL